MIGLPCSPMVSSVVKEMRKLCEMSNSIEITLHTTESDIGRQDLTLQFCAFQPTGDTQHIADLTKLNKYRIQLEHTEDAITDQDVWTDIFILLPVQYLKIIMGV
jgi:hypothetical protein